MDSIANLYYHYWSVVGGICKNNGQVRLNLHCVQMILSEDQVILVEIHLFQQMSESCRDSIDQSQHLVNLDKVRLIRGNIQVILADGHLILVGDQKIFPYEKVNVGNIQSIPPGIDEYRTRICELNAM